MEINITEKQAQDLKSMSNYWEEVSQREDTSPLDMELMNVHRTLGSKNILAMIKFYLDDQFI